MDEYKHRHDGCMAMVMMMMRRQLLLFDRDYCNCTQQTHKNEFAAKFKYVDHFCIGYDYVLIQIKENN